MLEDGVEALPDLADAVALLLSEVPEDYDVLYLCVPPAVASTRRARAASSGRPFPRLSAYVASHTAGACWSCARRAGPAAPRDAVVGGRVGRPIVGARALRSFPRGGRQSGAGTPEVASSP